MKYQKNLRQHYCPKCFKSLLALKGHTPVCWCGTEMLLGGPQKAKFNLNPIKNSKRTTK